MGVLALYKRLAEESKSDYRFVLSAIINDYLFRCPTFRFASLLTKTQQSPVFLYEFSRSTRIPGYSFCDGLSCHTAELPYVFDHTDIIAKDYAWRYTEPLNTSQLSSTEEGSIENEVPKTKALALKDASFREQADVKLAHLMADLWTNIAKYKDPNGLPSSVNGYKPGTRIAEAPWWPQLFGRLPSVEGVKEIENIFRSRFSTTSTVPLLVHDKGRGVNRSEILVSDRAILTTTPSSSSYSSPSMIMTKGNVGRQLLGGDVKVAAALRKAETFFHLFQFDEAPEMRIVELDCVCSFWNKLNYRF